MDPEFAIVIPSKNWKNLKICITSLFHNIEGSAPIIVVDDGLEEHPQAPQIQYIPGVKPFIFSRNANLGFQAAGNKDVFLMNDDTMLLTFKGITRMSLAAHHYGIVSAALSHAFNKNQLDHQAKEIREEQNVLCFVGVYIPRWVYKQLGPLDEQFDQYGWEDNDYCHRARLAGIPMGVYDGCLLSHDNKFQASTYRSKPFEGQMEQARQLFLKKWFPSNR